MVIFAVTVNITICMKNPYLTPVVEVLPLRLDDVLCASKLRFSGDEGVSGNDIEEEQIINGGSF